MPGDSDPTVTVNTRDHTTVNTSLLLLALVLAGIAATVFYYQSAVQVPNPVLLRVGVLPDQNPAALRRNFKPLLDHLAAQSGIEARLIIPSDYADIVRMFRLQEIDLAYMGGLTFVQAQAETDAEALVMREIDTRFTTWFISRPELASTRLSALRNKSFLFGDKLSTSGHLMPRHFLEDEWNLEPETFFSEVSYSGAHDKTVFMVRDGHYDIGAVNASIVRRMIDDGRVAGDELQVVWQTPPYPDYVWAIQPNLDENLKTRLRNAFLQLDSERPDDRAILDSLGAKVFLPAGHSDFTMLGDIASSRGLLRVAAQ